MITLTDAERRHFADWLEYEALTDKELIEQLKLLGPPAAMMMRHKESQRAACLIVARVLRSIESQSIGGN